MCERLGYPPPPQYGILEMHSSAVVAGKHSTGNEVLGNIPSPWTGWTICRVWLVRLEHCAAACCWLHHARRDGRPSDLTRGTIVRWRTDKKSDCPMDLVETTGGSNESHKTRRF